MYKMKIKLIILLASIFVFNRIPCLAEELNIGDKITIDDYQYEITSTKDKTLKVVGYSGTSTGPSVPATVDYEGETYKVATLGSYAFCHNNTAIAIYIESIDYIEENAIWDCSALQAVFFNHLMDPSHFSYPFISICPNVISYKVRQHTSDSKLTTQFQGNDLAYNNEVLRTVGISNESGSATKYDLIAWPPSLNVDSYIVPIGCSEIMPYAFADSKYLKKVDTGGGTFLDKIGSYAFKNSSIEEFTANKVLSIDEYAFSGCRNLKKFTFYDYHYYSSNFKSIPRGCFIDCISLESINLPDPVESIGESAFQSCQSLKSVYFPFNLKSIGTQCFRDCVALNNISLNSKIESINAYAFAGCKTLGILNFKNCTSLTNIGDYAFYECRDMTSTASESYLTLSNGLPKNIQNIGSYAFSFSGLHTGNHLNIPSSLTSIGTNPFAENQDLQYFSCDPNGEYITYGDALLNKEKTRLICYPKHCKEEHMSSLLLTESYIVPHTVTEIDPYAFMGNEGLHHIVLPSNITTIPLGCFWKCSGIEAITIPAKVTKLGAASFAGCTGLKEIVSLPKKPMTLTVSGSGKEGRLSIKPFAGVLHSCALYAKHDATNPNTNPVELYKADEGYNTVFSKITHEIPLTIGDSGYITIGRDFDVNLVSSINPDLIPYTVSKFNAADATISLKRLKCERPTETYNTSSSYIPARLPDTDGVNSQYIGIIIKGTPNKTYNIRIGIADYSYPVTYWRPSGDYTNLLKTDLVETYLTKTLGSNTIFVMKDGKFRKVSAEGIIPFNRAYLTLPTSEVEKMDQYNNGSKALSVVFEDEELPTAIDAITVNEERISDGSYYTLSGVRVKCPGKGVYIRNGKKVVIK